MKYNLISPFLIREADLIIDDIPKSQVIQLIINHHSIFSPEENIRISLLLYGIFSYFLSKHPSNEVLNNKDLKVLFLIQGIINLYSTIYSENEPTILDHEDNIKERPKRVLIPMDDILSNLEMESAAIISEIETEKVLSNYYNKSLYYNIINNLAEKLELDGELSKIKMSLGLCNIHRS